MNFRKSTPDKINMPIRENLDRFPSFMCQELHDIAGRLSTMEISRSLGTFPSVVSLKEEQAVR